MRSYSSSYSYSYSYSYSSGKNKAAMVSLIMITRQSKIDG